MLRFKAFLKRHLLWVGFLLVLLPLLVLLLLQYRSLTALETALPARRKEEMKNFLQAVTHEVEAYYRSEAERALALPVNTINNRINGHVVVRGALTDETALPPVAATAEHFRAQQFPGTKSFFFALKYACEGRSFCSIFFYDAARRAIKRDMNSPLWVAAQQAASGYCTKVTLKAVEPPAVVGIKIEPDYHFLLRPLADEEGKLIGIVGAELDQQYFRETLLPQAIRNAVAKYFPAQQQEVIVTLRDAENRLLLSNQSDAPAEAEAQLSSTLVFRDWTLGVRMRGLTEAQTARRVFWLNLSLSALMALVVSGGLWLALRTAAREMKLSQMKSDFVSNVSHELRTPLSSIQVFGELLKLGRVTDTESVREFGAYIETESRRLTGLINNILDFSHIESGRKEYQFAPTDLGALIAETVKAYEVRLKHEGFDLRLVAAPTPLVAVDAEAIAQAFVNLLDNAAKYSGSARVIEVRVQAQREAVTIAVSDHGIGIAPDEQEKIFEKFYRAGSSLVHDVKGSGLGLSIVRHVIAAHRGHVTVASELGQGSTFTIHLPVTQTKTTDAVVTLQPSLEGK
jgi:signal transduction histidine kinase